MAQQIVAKIVAQFPEEVLATEAFRGDETLVVHRDRAHQLCQWLKETPTLDFNMLMDLCGVDYPERAERFDVVYHLYSTRHHHRLRLKVRVGGEEPTVESVTDIWAGANWYERECFDLFGVRFRGHPHLTRILTFPEFEGHPLRKDYPIDRRPQIPTPDSLSDRVVPRGAGQTPDDLLHHRQMLLNMGPSHPTMHGTLRVLLTLDGEQIIGAEPEIGYLHRCFEKESEDHTYTQIIPYTDRLNYVSPLMNNVGFAMAVEKLMGIEVPPRAQYIRVIIAELSRIMDHMVCIGTNLVDLGALTNFWYFFNVREMMYVWVEALTGARLTNTYTRIGGVARDLPEGFIGGVRKNLREYAKAVADVRGLIAKNRIYLDRTRDVGVISREDAIAYGFTGPSLRATGEPYDVRKVHPYLCYDEFDFDIPVGAVGDSYDRIEVRFEEMRQSQRIIEQALAKIPEGPIINPQGQTALPPKHEVYNSIEGLIRHFEIIMFGIKPPPGEVYGFTEAANGELGFYIVSDGSGKPYRIKVRPPCFAIYQAYPLLIQNRLLADAIAVLGNLNIVAGELDR
ncbi:MAG: NADH dehydrogenase (quinone) subunit D [Deltaproteobacteria bacterium]|nr:NADH dehydrogenase (quinone) subunit D [Deltaproteobacteria bacterium]